MGAARSRLRVPNGPGHRRPGGSRMHSVRSGMVLPIGDLASALHHLPGAAQLGRSAGGNISDIHTDWAMLAPTLDPRIGTLTKLARVRDSSSSMKE